MISATTSMWFPAGNRPHSVRACPAFTLIEIMVVVAIFGIVLSMGMPAIYRVFHKESLSQAVADIEEACHQARSQAIIGGAPTEIVIRADGISGPSAGARLPENVAFTEIVVNGLPYTPEDLDANGGEVRAHFYPNGTCDDVAVSLRSDQFEERKIALECTTGLTMVKLVR
jgi:prepilin-type N-terminal cleavage/methylation domain-containing protein